MKASYFFIGIILLFSLSACNVDFNDFSQDRIQYAKENKGDIVFAVFDRIYPEKSEYVRGIQLAAEVINKRPQKLLNGRELKLLIHHDNDDFIDMQSTIRSVASNPKVTATLGHYSSHMAFPASLIYEKSKILFFPPISTSPLLTRHGFQYIFPMLPNNEVMAAQLVSISKALRYEKLVLMYSRDNYNQELALNFREAALKRKANVVKSISFFSKSQDYRTVIADLLNEDFDAIALFTGVKPAINMVKQMRQMGIKHPIMANDALNSDDYLKAGEFTNNTLVPTYYQQNIATPENLFFTKKYKKKYNEKPGDLAAQGYDTVMLLSHLINLNQSTVPTFLVSTLHYNMPFWVGATGIHHFDSDGIIDG